MTGPQGPAGPQGPPGPSSQGPEVSIDQVICTPEGLVSVQFTTSGIVHDSEALTYIAQLISPSGNVVHSAEITIPSGAPNPASSLTSFTLSIPPGTYIIVVTPNGH